MDRGVVKSVPPCSLKPQLWPACSLNSCTAMFFGWDMSIRDYLYAVTMTNESTGSSCVRSNGLSRGKNCVVAVELYLDVDRKINTPPLSGHTCGHAHFSYYTNTIIVSGYLFSVNSFAVKIRYIILHRLLYW